MMDKFKGIVLVLIFGCAIQFILGVFIGYDPGIELGIVGVFASSIAIGILITAVFAIIGRKGISKKLFWRTILIILIINLIILLGFQRWALKILLK